jgi:glucose-6-phosphate dehydrogenase assembly protein OpcA
MEDLVSGMDDTRLLPAGTDVPFREVGRSRQRAAGAQPSDRALIATVVVTGSHARLVDAAAALEAGSTGGAVRAVLISAGDDPAPPARIVGHAVALEGLLPDFIDNAVAALRLSSLPTLVWWRGGSPETLRALAALADRLVLDEDQPEATWAWLPKLAQYTAVSDLRWARLTRWRALTAHFFDIPDVRAGAPGFTRLAIAAGDRHAARLFAGWLASALGWTRQVSIDIRDVPDGATIEAVTLAGGDLELELGLLQGGTCVHTAARLGGRECAARTVALGDGGVAALIAEELRVRSRDLAFERAVAALGEMV